MVGRHGRSPLLLSRTDMSPSSAVKQREASGDPIIKNFIVESSWNKNVQVQVLTTGSPAPFADAAFKVRK
ncbi:hypothetical protein NC651_015779 [Populus alba x Populus x berolinensis]|nr:hypothetical protein NC651_015779 [Populus alba x Populus x berolinensis]